jgi:tRNA (guanosine-2'-O-)-methyltransferase
MRRDEPDNFDLDPVRTAGLPADAETVISALEPLLTSERRQRIEQVLSTRSRAVIAVLDGVIDPHNVSAVLRSADAFGVQEVHLIDRGEAFLASPRVAQGSHRWLTVVQHASAAACVAALHARGHRVYIASMEGALRPEALAREPKLAIVFGNEHAGVSDELRALADGFYAIPMQGFVQSLNVSVAAGITLFAAMQGRPGDLEPSEQLQLRARACMLSVPRADEVLAECLRRRRIT